MAKFEYTWGETVKVSIDAPKKYKPGKLAEICSKWEIETKENSLVHSEPVGTIIYSVEFGDGSIIDIPSRYIETYQEK